uniref:Adiponectin receptor protein n=1 Tax=Syphacia muris TaxID=451379 RepID=A0A0N5AFA9_9BILA
MAKVRHCNENVAVNPDYDSDVKKALQEAREILTGVRKETFSNHDMLEESTRVQMLKSGDKMDPVEVVVSRSTIVSQTNSEDELDSGSEQEEDKLFSRILSCVHRTHHRTRSLGELDHVSHDSRHTNVRYRRVRGDSWLLDDGTEQPTDGQLETWEAKWTVQKFEYLPEWLQDNEYLRHGHRPPLPSFAECFRSILALHTETGNIWTHLIGCVAFALLAAWFLTRPDTHIKFQEKLVFSFFFAGAILCLGMSFTFHTVSCHSIGVVRIFCKLDYLGISLLIIGSFIPWIYYGFYCRREPKITYIAMVTVLGIGAVIVSLWDKFSEPRYRPLRAGVFCAMGLSGVVPTVHFVITDGVASLFEEASFHWLLLMAALYLTGALLYATRTPERFFPGKCDIWFQSHQIFHVCVVIAAFVHYYGVSEMALNRLTASCPMDNDAVRAFHKMVDSVKKVVHDAL